MISEIMYFILWESLKEQSIACHSPFSNILGIGKERERCRKFCKDIPKIADIVCMHATQKIKSMIKGTFYSKCTCNLCEFCNKKRSKTLRSYAHGSPFSLICIYHYELLITYKHTITAQSSCKTQYAIARISKTLFKWGVSLKVSQNNSKPSRFFHLQDWQIII